MLADDFVSVSIKIVDSNQLGTIPSKTMIYARPADSIYLVSRKGVEPLTYGLGNRCSILLSYRDLPIGLANKLRYIRCLTMTK